MLALVNPFVLGASLAPDDITELDIWWDPSDGSYTTESGGVITSIANKGGGGAATLLQPVANSAGATAPALTTSDGIDWADYDRTTKNVLRLPYNNAVFPRGSGSFTMIAVIRSSDTTNLVTAAGQRLDLSGGGMFLGIQNGTEAGNMDHFIRNASGTSKQPDATDTDVVDGTTRVIALMRDNDASANGEVSAWLDGTLIGTATDLGASFGSIDLPSPSASADDLMLGARPAGGTTIYQNFTDALIGDVLVYGKALSESEMSSLTSYLRTKWKA